MENKSVPVFIVIITVVISMMGSVTILLAYSDVLFENQEQGSKYTTSYVDITVPEAKELIESDDSLTVIDCRGGCRPCNWNRGKLPNAVWDDNPENYYNYTTNVLVYCTDGAKSVKFCQDLVGHTFGKIYNLIGGLNEWKRF